MQYQCPTQDNHGGLPLRTDNKMDVRTNTEAKMLYRTVEKTGDRLSILGFGCMCLPHKRGQPGSGRIDEDRAQKLEKRKQAEA
jgi:hypothetical protein